MLLAHRTVATKHAIRHRLITILLLGALTSALSLIALVRLYSVSTAQRVERARETVVETEQRMERDPGALATPSPSGFVGLRAGTWRRVGTGAPPDGLPADWAPQVRATLAQAAFTGARATSDAPLGDSTLVVAASPDGAWAAYLVLPLAHLQTWLAIILSLSAVTVVLVGFTVYTMVTVGRGAAALRASLAMLANDLASPIPRPRVRELGDIADGIAGLAEKLARAREEEERLGRELRDRERLAALGRVAAGVAHEVRNPLASIKLRLDLAAAQATLPPAVQGAIAHASSEIARLDRLVADLLVVAGRAVGTKRDTSLGALLAARADALAPWAKQRGVTVRATGDATRAIDADGTARALDNLLRNAVEASPDGSEVAAKVFERDGVAVIRVEDRGPGVAPARVPELFEPFFTTKPDGTGLGLAISRAIARAHGGDVEYSRESGVTCFDLTFGAAAPHREAAE
jgi:signal transduction histidine kinase